MLFPALGFHLPAIATEASREQKGTRGNRKESRGRLRRTEEHRPPSTTQQTQRHRRVLQGTVILRPQRRGLSGGTPAGQEPVPIRVGGQTRIPSRERPRRRSPSHALLRWQVEQVAVPTARPPAGRSPRRTSTSSMSGALVRWSCVAVMGATGVAAAHPMPVGAVRSPRIRLPCRQRLGDRSGSNWTVENQAPVDQIRHRIGDL